MKRILSTLFVLSFAAAMTFSAAAQVDKQGAGTATTLREHLKEAERTAPKQQQAERTSGQ
jgi:hypothetical protein